MTISSTGVSKLDRTIETMIGIFESRFPSRISGYYLTGSYAVGTAIASSDVDISVLFRGGFDGKEELHTAHSLAQSCADLDDQSLDAVPLEDPPRYPIRTVILKDTGRLLYGTDVRDDISMPSVTEFAHHATDLASRLILELRNLNQPVLPLTCPDESDEFLGYIPKDESG